MLSVKRANDEFTILHVKNEPVLYFIFSFRKFFQVVHMQSNDCIIHYNICVCVIPLHSDKSTLAPYVPGICTP